MKSAIALFLFGIVALPAAAQDRQTPALETVPAGEVALADFLWQKRPLVVFADSPNDPAFRSQIEYLADDPAELLKRDVIVLTDSDPDSASDARERLRPRGFSMVLLDKDGAVKLRKPLPWSVREITHAIDKFPLRRQEILEELPSGR